MVQNQIYMPTKIYTHTNTQNQSFLKMHYYLKAKGNQNNAFFLAIYDPDLMRINPRDPNLPPIYRQKVLRECLFNFWYFIREIVRIPDEGGSIAEGKVYNLHRGNLAMNFLFTLNFNIFLELPRQHGKTVSALCWYLWVFNFGTSNSSLMFINKKHEDSKNNLITMKRLRSALPSYLRFDEVIGRDGKKIKVPNTAETLQHPTNFNKIRTMPGARTRQLANGLGRGCTMPIHYYDEFAFIMYNKIIYGSAYPAYSTASRNARANRAPYGILITTTPGDLTTDEGLFAESIKNNATPWTEAYYDYSPEKLQALKEANVDSTFFYVRYTYQQLGSGDDYFKEMVIGLEKDWVTIRREVLLEWTKAATNCPFRQEDLDTIRGLCKSDPRQILLFGRVGQYQLKIWETIDMSSIPIIGVDVSGGWNRDASAITIIDSKTTKVIATFACNYIPTFELADMIYQIVTVYLKNAVVNVETNGGYGASVIQYLMKTKIKKNLYYEIKDRPLEERNDGVRNVIRTVKMKVYGTNSTKDVRNDLIELLHIRVSNHKDKFTTVELLEELESMEVKKNGKTEHASNSHDDLVFSYLMALHVWYNGTNLRERYNIIKNDIKTDEDFTEVMTLEEQYSDMVIETYNVDENELVEQQMEALKADKNVKLGSEWKNQEHDQDQLELDNLLRSNKAARHAYAKQNNFDVDELNSRYMGGSMDITGELNSIMYGDTRQEEDIQGNLMKEFMKV